MSDLKYGRINLIKSNCGSGKSYFSIHTLAEQASDLSHVVYLTDSVAMRDKLSHEINCKRYEPSDKDILNGKLIHFDKGKIVVMTYAKMGLLLKYFPNTFDAVEIIICDEIHRIKDFIEMSRKDTKKHFPGVKDEEIDYWLSVSCGAYLASNYIERMAAGLSLTNDEKNVKQKLVVALSATPTKAYALFSNYINDIRLNAQTIAYETFHTIYYTNLGSALCNIPKGMKTICYVPFIRDILKSVELVQGRGLKAIGIWSINNKQHPMNEEQLKVREHILVQEELPEEYDFIFINSSYETAINIKGDVDCIIIHSTDKDTQVQVRYRYRGDLEVQYLLMDSNEVSSLKIPTDFLNTYLDKEKKKELCEFLNFRNNSGHKVGWPTTKKYLIEAGFEIKDCKPRINGKQVCCSIITYKEEEK